MGTTAMIWLRLQQRLDEPSSWPHRSILIAAVLLGFLLRWYTLFVGHAFSLVEIRDEVTALKFALNFLAGAPNSWYLASPSLDPGHLPGPLWTMMVAAFYKLGGNSAEGAIFWMIVLNSIVIYLVYLFASHLLPARYALFTALFYSLAPWPIYYAGGLYNPIPTDFIGVLLFWAFWQTINVEQSRAVFWVMLLGAAIPQFHAIGVFYYPLFLLLLWISPARLNPRWLIAGFLAAASLYIPYLLGEIHHHWANFHAVQTSPHKFSWGILKILTIPAEILSNFPGGWSGNNVADFKAFANHYFVSYVLLLAINLVSFVLAMFFIYGFVRKFYKAVREARFNLKTAILNQRLTVFLGILLVLPLLLYILLGKAYASRYSIFIFPLLFLLPALYISQIKSMRIKRFVIYALAAMFLCNIYLVLAFYADQNHKLTTSAHYLPAFYKLDKLYTALRHDAGPNKLIAVDTTHYTIAGNQYSEVATDAIRSYIETYQAHLQPVSIPRQTKRYILVNKQSKVPAGARIVFTDNGLVIYTR